MGLQLQFGHGGAGPGSAGYSPYANLLQPHETDVTSAAGQAAAANYGARIPLKRRCKSGKFIKIAELRRDSIADFATAAFWYMESFDGNVWTQPKEIFVNASYAQGANWQSLGELTVDTQGRVHLHYTTTLGDGAGNTTAASVPWYTYSDDECKTWSTPVDLTSTCMHVDATHPASQPACYNPSVVGAWGWFRFGPGAGLQLAQGAKAGRIIVPFVYRIGLSGSATSHMGTIVCDNPNAATPTWALGGGLDVTVSANDDSNESFALECGNGDIYFGIRKLNSGFRASSRSTNQGDTLSTMIVENGTGGSQTALVANDCQGSGIVMPNGDMYMVFPNDSSIRGGLALAKSTNNGQSWVIKTIYYGYSAYSAITAVSNNQLLVAFECTDDPVGDQGTFASTAAIRLVRIPIGAGNEWITDTTPPDFVWDFNQWANNYTLATTDRIMERNWHCDSYGYGSASAVSKGNYLSLGGATKGPLLWRKNPSAGKSPPTMLLSTSMTIEFVIRMANGIADGPIMTSRLTTALALGYGVTVASGKLVFAIRRTIGTAHYEVTTSARWDDGAWHSFRFERDIVAQTLRVYVDGVLDASAVLTGTFETNALTVSADIVLGSFSDGTTCSTFDIQNARLTMQISTSGFLTVGGQRPWSAQNGIYASVPANDVGTLPGLVLRLCDPNDGGLHFAVDETGGGIPPAGLARGRAVNGQRCRVSGARFASHGGTRFTGCWFDYDSVIGWHVRHSYSTVSGAAGAAEGLLTTLYDFIQNNMTWTFSGCFYFSSNPSHGQTLFSNNNSTSGNPGIDIVRDQTTRKISVLAGDGTGPRFSEQPIANAPAMSDAGWYYVGLNCAGSGKIDGYVGPFPGLLQPPVLTHFQSTNSVARSNGNFASTKVPSIAQRPDGQNAADLRSKQILLANVAWTAAQHQQAAAQAVYQPSKRGRNRLRNGTIRRLAKDLIGR